MSDVAVHIEQLSKAYRITHAQSKHTVVRYKTLQEDLLALPRRLWSAVRKVRSSSNRETVWALKDVSLDIHEGEVVGIIGRNGAGKSTLLKILSRITDPTEGRAEVYGRVGSLLEVGTGFHPELTGRENVFLNGAMLGMRRYEIVRKFDEIVAFAEVEKFIDTPVKRYSSGMYVRLAFAIAAHLDPEILIVDEVLAVGDAQFQKKCMGKMSEVAGEGRTILFVSHNMAAVQRLCTRAVLLSQGEVVKDDKTSEVIDHYLESGLSQQGERLWSNISQAPGDEVVRLRAIRAINRHGKVSSSFTVREPICLEVEFNVLTGGSRLDVSLSLYDTSDNLIFATLDTSTIEWQGKPRPAGIYRAQCEIPGDFLNEGSIRIMVVIVTNPGALHAIEKDALQIGIVDNLELGGARGIYTREWAGGNIRPLLHWSTTYIPGISAK